MADLVEAVRASNSAKSDASAIDEITRQELIVILETALNMLKGPMVERAFLGRASTWFGGLAVKVLEHEAVSYLGGKLGDAAEALKSFLQFLK